MTYNVNIHAFPPSWFVTNPRIVDEDIDGFVEELFTFIPQAAKLVFLGDIASDKVDLVFTENFTKFFNCFLSFFLQDIGYCDKRSLL